MADIFQTANYGLACLFSTSEKRRWLKTNEGKFYRANTSWANIVSLFKRSKNVKPTMRKDKSLERATVEQSKADLVAEAYTKGKFSQLLENKKRTLFIIACVVIAQALLLSVIRIYTYEYREVYRIAREDVDNYYTSYGVMGNEVERYGGPTDYFMYLELAIIVGPMIAIGYFRDKALAQEMFGRGVLAMIGTVVAFFILGFFVQIKLGQPLSLLVVCVVVAGGTSLIWAFGKLRKSRKTIEKLSALTASWLKSPEISKELIESRYNEYTKSGKGFHKYDYFCDYVWDITKLRDENFL